MITIQTTKRNRKRSLFKFHGFNLKSLPPVAILMVGVGLGALITQQVLPPAQQAWITPVVQDVPVRVCFTPESQCTPGIVDAIHSSKSSIFVQAYSFTSEPIANALVGAKKRGVDVQVILDKSQPTAKGSQLNTLLRANIPVLIDVVTGIAHNKMEVYFKVCKYAGFLYRISIGNVAKLLKVIVHKKSSMTLLNDFNLMDLYNLLL